LAQICTKSFVGWGFAPDATGEAPDHLAGLGVGPPGKGKEGRGRGKRKRRGEGVEGRIRKGRESRNAQIQSWQA